MSDLENKSDVQPDKDSSVVTSDLVSSDVTLVSSDSKKFKVPKNVACLSNIVKEMIDDDENDEDDQEIPLTYVKSDVLEKVLEFCTHCATENDFTKIEKPLSSNEMKNIVPRWYAQYINDMSQEMLFEVILASNFMHVQQLLDLGCAKIASMMKGESPENIKELFGISEEITESDIEQTKRDNQWLLNNQ
jgi:S-phase kinase-associated protein 1